MTATASEQLGPQVESIDWYHTLELAPGIITPGWLDHRPILHRLPLPASLEGKRCLDVGTFNGFWAFEMERRSASEVIAIDVLDPYRWDWPWDSSEDTVSALAARMAAGRGFEIASDALGSSARRVELSVYELDSSQLGVFDFVFVGSLLVHLRDPVGALQRIRSVCSEDASLVVMDGIDLLLSLRSPRLPLARLDAHGRPWWWYANARGLVRIIEAAGFEVIFGPRRLLIPPGRGCQTVPFDPRLLMSREGRTALILAWLGDPHAAILARPRKLSAWLSASTASS